MTLVLIASVLFSIYIILMSIYIFGFLRIDTFTEATFPFTEKNIYISVLIAFKNEEDNLPLLISSLNSQTLQKDLFEVIFINDHSIDKSEILIKHNIKKNESFKYINQEPQQRGKKAALIKGIQSAKGELIVTTDADCRSSKYWLETILKYYLRYKPKMIIGPVFLEGNGILSDFQALEFSSLAGATAGSAGINKPIMCNGANLAYQKDIFNTETDLLNSKEISGDDIFLMHHIKKTSNSEIHYLKSLKGTVFTKSEKSFRDFFRQRIRWASKSKAYKDFDTIFSSLLVFLVNFLILLLLSLSFVNLVFLKPTIILIASKLLIDFIVVFVTLRFFKKTKLLKYFLPLYVIYPFYITITGAISIFRKKIRWK